MTGASNDGWEDGSWGIVSGEPSFAHTGTIVDNQSGNVFVAHVCCLELFPKIKNEMNADCAYGREMIWQRLERSRVVLYYGLV